MLDAPSRRDLRRARGAVPMQDPELLNEVDALRRDVTELQERVDFTERLLLQQQERAQVGRGGNGQ